MAEHEHKTLGVTLVIAEITQGHVERLLENVKRALDEFSVESFSRLPLSRQDGIMVRAAVAAGWISTPSWKVEDVSNLKPAVVRWCARVIDKEYAEATSLPPV
jgi:hypothetical protein